VADPDLNLEKATNPGGRVPLPPRPLRVALHGRWRLIEAAGTVCAWQLPNTTQDVRALSQTSTETVLEILCRHGASYDLKLAP
jgi:hypothetical protein